MYSIFIVLTQSPNNDPNNQQNTFLSPQEKEQQMQEFRDNYGYISPETQQKVIRNKYVSPASLQRDLEFYNQDEYIGKFTKGDEQWLKK